MSKSPWAAFPAPTPESLIDRLHFSANPHRQLRIRRIAPGDLNYDPTATMTTRRGDSYYSFWLTTNISGLPEGNHRAPDHVIVIRYGKELVRLPVYLGARRISDTDDEIFAAYLFADDQDIIAQLSNKRGGRK
jgi:hypothetical protein